MNVISIHQPNFMPWYPFFQKIADADIFVLLNNCQYEKGGYQNRFNMNSRWYTMGVNKSLDSISEKKYTNAYDDWVAIKRRLPEYSFILDNFDDCISESLVHTNNSIIYKIVRMLNIDTKIEIDFPTDKVATKRLVELCKFYDGDVYISGISGPNYMETEMFDRENISIKIQEDDSSTKVPILKYLKDNVYV